LERDRKLESWPLKKPYSIICDAILGLLQRLEIEKTLCSNNINAKMNAEHLQKMVESLSADIDLIYEHAVDLLEREESQSMNQESKAKAASESFLEQKSI